MDEKGHLVVSDETGKELFRGKSYAETGVLNELTERGGSRRERRAQAAIERKLRAALAKATA